MTRIRPLFYRSCSQILLIEKPWWGTKTKYFHEFCMDMVVFRPYVSIPWYLILAGKQIQFVKMKDLPTEIRQQGVGCSLSYFSWILNYESTVRFRSRASYERCYYNDHRTAQYHAGQDLCWPGLPADGAVTCKETQKQSQNQPVINVLVSVVWCTTFDPDCTHICLYISQTGLKPAFQLTVPRCNCCWCYKCMSKMERVKTTVFSSNELQKKWKHPEDADPFRHHILVNLWPFPVTLAFDRSFSKSGNFVLAWLSTLPQSWPKLDLYELTLSCTPDLFILT